mmetsp:Transcript_35638/g.83244  ORF Transcript_35638/g.83244 Transcript_35638/m.83244 type:complete len:323 (+) Transcript_35638:356-1324(+)
MHVCRLLGPLDVVAGRYAHRLPFLKVQPHSLARARAQAPAVLVVGHQHSLLPGPDRGTYGAQAKSQLRQQHSQNVIRLAEETQGHLPVLRCLLQVQDHSAQATAHRWNHLETLVSWKRYRLCQAVILFLGVLIALAETYLNAFFCYRRDQALKTSRSPKRDPGTWCQNARRRRWKQQRSVSSLRGDLVGVETAQARAKDQAEVSRLCIFPHPWIRLVVEGATILHHWIARVVPTAVDLIDALLREASLLWEAIMVLLDPAMKQALSPQKSQGMMCKGWRGCTRVVLPSHGVLTGKGRLANHGGGDAGTGVGHSLPGQLDELG